MKKRACIGLLLTSLMVSLAAATPAAALAQPRESVAAYIPFDFYVAGRTMPAGEYTVRQISTGDGALQIQSADGRQSVMFLTQAALKRGRSIGPARLVFNRYEGQRFLSTVWQSGGEGHALRASKRERALRKELRVAQGNGGAATGMEVVVVLARLETK